MQVGGRSRMDNRSQVPQRNAGPAHVAENVPTGK